MRDLYICSGQYHVFCSLLLKMIDNADCEGDLLICDCFEGASDLYARIKSESHADKEIKTFDNVFFLNGRLFFDLNAWNIANKAKKAYAKLTERFKKEKNRLESILDESYSRIFIAGPVSSLVEFCLYEYEHNNCDIYLFDDGLGSRVQWKKPGIPIKLIDFRRVKFGKVLKGKYFFSTNRVERIYPYIPVLDQCKPLKFEVDNRGLNYEAMLDHINRIFKYDTSLDLLQNMDAVYYSAGYDLYDRLSDYSQIECELVNYINKKELKFAVKKHPNSKERYNDSIVSVPQGLPEISFMNLELENKLLISSASATVFNPSFIFDKNPFLILTYRLFGDNDTFARNLFSCSEREMIRKIEKTLFSGYLDHTKIFIPKTLGELDEAIEDYKKRSK